ncbi:helix-turn-helix domain-containing protein [Anoxybacteroides rupiense]|uniref:helix-turn-helix domain-containing protein n=1 Tax=Anoxybacteroides rupiense TaxID=311460 RepID=UPI0035D8C5C3
MTAVRLVMKGYTGKEIAHLCHPYRQSVATYVKKFHKEGIEALLERKCGLGPSCFLTAERQNELKQVILATSLSDYLIDWADDTDHS